jgi:hypothetical protein
MADGDDPPLYCPFEADWYARDKGSPVDFTAGEDNVLPAEEFLPESVAHGTCPHRAMGVLLGEADVVVGNYNHLFDPKSRPLLSAVLDEKGLDVVFVMKGGESFERRTVRLGVRDRGMVEILDGVVPGEHVVSEGVYYVKLAGTSEGSTGHGHAH